MATDHKELVGIAALRASGAMADMTNALLSEESATLGAFRNRCRDALEKLRGAEEHLIRAEAEAAAIAAKKS